MRLRVPTVVLTVLATAAVGLVAVQAQPAGVAVERLSGPDRFTTAAAVSAATFPDGADRVFLATGTAFADALAGGAASRGEAPVLLTGPDVLPAGTRAELARLDVDEVVVLGGTAAVSGDVAAEAAVAAGAGVRRLGGADRVATAVAVSQWAFPDGAEVVHVATGTDFPDALAGGVPAGLAGGPVLLSGPDAVPAATLDELRRLAPAQVVVLGGTAAISEAVAADLADVAPVERLAGADRFATAAAVSRDTFERADTVVVATGRTFADALAGTPAAIEAQAPLLLVEQAGGATFADAPDATVEEVRRLRPDRIVVLGGNAAVDEATVQVLVEAATTTGPAESPTETPAPTPTPTTPPSGGGGGPVVTPTDEPTEEPTDEPTEEPTDEPTEEPTDEPTEEPTDEPTDEPTEDPDTVVPVFADGAALTFSDVTTTGFTVGWPAATDDVAVTGYTVLVDGSTVGTVGADVRTLAVTGRTPDTTHQVAVTAGDEAGNVSAPLEGAVDTLPVPDPGAAPPVSPTRVTTTFDALAFLHEGPDPAQRLADGSPLAPDAIEPRRAAGISGTVLDVAGQGLAGVTVAVNGQPQLGQVVSRADGRWDLAVNGGGPVTVTFSADGVLPVQRTAEVAWQEWAPVEDVVMVPLAPGQAVDLTTLPTATHGVVRGPVTDDGGTTRQGTLLFPAGVQAALRFDDGTSTPASSLTVHITEYTVGPDGPARMPALLPPTSAYTYAFELTADEAVTAGADGVDFTGPLPIYYAEEFVGAPVGGAIPFGTYDADTATWQSEADGRVVAITGVSGGLAQVDTDGDGSADDGVGTGLSPAMTDAERRTLADLYGDRTPPVRLQRVPVDSFSPKDPNFPPVQGPGEGPPQLPGSSPGDPDDPGEPPEDRRPDDRTEDFGTVIATTGELRERIPLAGTSLSLAYSSQSVTPPRTVRTAVVGQATAAPTLTRVDVHLDVAGRRITQSFLPADLDAGDATDVALTWDGLDRLGRQVFGGQRARLLVAYHYPVRYQLPEGLDAASFGLYPTGDGETFLRDDGRGNPVTRPLTAQRDLVLDAGYERGDAGLGGWALDVHHRYDPISQVLIRGDGSRRAVSVEREASTLLGFDMACDQAFFDDPVGDGCRAIGPQVAGQPLQEVTGLAPLPDGSLLIVQHDEEDDVVPASVLRLSPDGQDLEVVVDEADCVLPPGATEDACQATAIAAMPDGTFWVGHQRGRLIHYTADGTVIADVHGSSDEPNGLTIVDLAVAPDGSLVIGERQGILQLPPGGDTPVRLLGDAAAPGCADPRGGCPAQDISLQDLRGVAVDDTGRIIFAETRFSASRRATDTRQVTIPTDSSFVWEITPAGTARALAGFGTAAAEQGTPAADALLLTVTDVGLARDGRVLVHEGGTLWGIGDGGLLQRLAGRDGPCPDQACGEGAPSSRLLLEGVPAVTGTPDGRILVADPFDGAIRQVDPALPGFDGEGITIPDPDGVLLQSFDAAGRHLATINSLTGADVITFGYDADGRLAAVTEVVGATDAQGPPGSDPVDLTTTIQRAADGTPTTIVGPFGTTTTLAVDAGGRLATVTNPNGEATTLAHDPDGLLEMVTGAVPGSVYGFTFDDGRVVAATDPAGNDTTWQRTSTADGYAVTTTSRTGLQTVQEVRRLTDGTLLQQRTDPDGTTSSVASHPDGTVTTTAASGMQTTTTQAPDPRFGMLAAHPGVIVTTTPAGLVREITATRTVDDPDAPTSLTVSEQVGTFQPTTTVVDLTDGTTTITSPIGVVATTEVDPQGRALVSRTADLPDVTTTYDQGRPVAVVQGDRDRTSNYSGPFLTAITDAQDQTTTFELDLVGRTTAAIDPLGQRTELGRDAHGNAVTITPPGQPAHAQAFDPFDAPTGYTPPGATADEATVTQVRDDDRRPVLTSRPDGDDVATTIDPTTGVVTGRTVGGLGTTTFTTDPATGLVTEVAGPDGVDLQLGYDGSLPTSEVQVRANGASTAVTRTYDDQHRTAEVTVGGSAPVAYTYDDAGSILGAGEAAITRDDLGRPVRVEVGAVATDWTFNAFGEVTGVTAVADGTTVLQQVITRDDLGRVIEAIEVVGGTSRTTTATYDGLGRLTEVAVDEGSDGPPADITRAYAYDANGNRTSGPEGAHTYDSRDRLTDAGWAHDEAGDPTATPDGSVAYDGAGNLRSAQVGTDTVTYEVDGLDRRVTRDDGTDVTGWVYDHVARPVAEVDPADGSVQRRYVYATSRATPEYLVDGSQVIALVRDHTGSPRLAIDALTGDVVQALDYDEFGNATLLSGAADLHPFRFQGGLEDPLTGWLRFGARDYDPALGRFTTRDPILFLGGQANLYLFAGGDPLNGRDPSGTGPTDPTPPPGGGGGGGCDYSEARNTFNAAVGTRAQGAGPTGVIPNLIQLSNAAENDDYVAGGLAYGKFGLDALVLTEGASSVSAAGGLFSVGGASTAAVTGGAGFVAATSINLAHDSIEAAADGRETPIDVAADYWGVPSPNRPGFLTECANQVFPRVSHRTAEYWE